MAAQVYAATQQNQKEKYEVDLKKEIKKLQRLRDQIKTWISSNDIKDKTALTSARKLIETKMEKFKVCEKETKTKTYSKEGLARAAVLDPEEQAKEDARSFLQNSIDKLGVQIESFEADVERLSSGKGMKRNKHELEEKDASIKKHRWHIGKMEQVIRMIDNDGKCKGARHASLKKMSVGTAKPTTLVPVHSAVSPGRDVNDLINRTTHHDSFTQNCSLSTFLQRWSRSALRTLRKISSITLSRMKIWRAWKT